MFRLYDINVQIEYAGEFHNPGEKAVNLNHWPTGDIAKMLQEGTIQPAAENSPAVEITPGEGA